MMYDCEMLPMWMYATYWAEDYGATIKFPTGRMSAPALVEPACKTLEEAENLEVLDLKELSKGPTMQRHWVALERAEKLLGPYFSAWSFPYEVFIQVAWWVGPERACLLVAQEPQLMHRLLKKAVEHCVNVNAIVAEKYGSAFIAASSLLTSNTLSPKQCVEFNINYLSDMIKKSLDAGAGPGIFYHLCGDHATDWELHKDVPMTPAPSCISLRGKEFHRPPQGHRRLWQEVLHPGKCRHHLLQIGTPAEVYEASKQQVLIGKERKKGFFAGTACEVPPFMPTANVYAFNQAVKDHGALHALRGIQPLFSFFLFLLSLF
jgi:uroporphyrinogen decarboxylase